MLAIKIALLITLFIEIVVLCFDLYSKAKEIKEQKTNII